MLASLRQRARDDSANGSCRARRTSSGSMSSSVDLVGDAPHRGSRRDDLLRRQSACASTPTGSVVSTTGSCASRSERPRRRDTPSGWLPDGGFEDTWQGLGVTRMPACLSRLALARGRSSSAGCRCVGRSAASADCAGGRVDLSGDAQVELDGKLERRRRRSTSRPSAGIRGRRRGRLGGGDGGPSPCTTQPFGPLAEVQAVWAAVNAQQAPDPSDPNYVEDVYNPAGDPRDDVVVESSWYRVRGPDIQVKYMVRCPGALAVERWVTVTPDAGGNLVPQVRAVDLLAAAARPGRAAAADARAAHRAGRREPQRVDVRPAPHVLLGRRQGLVSGHP